MKIKILEFIDRLKSWLFKKHKPRYIPQKEFPYNLPAFGKTETYRIIGSTPRVNDLENGLKIIVRAGEREGQCELDGTPDAVKEFFKYPGHFELVAQKEDVPVIKLAPRRQRRKEKRDAHKTKPLSTIEKVTDEINGTDYEYNLAKIAAEKIRQTAQKARRSQRHDTAKTPKA